MPDILIDSPSTLRQTILAALLLAVCLCPAVAAQEEPTGLSSADFIQLMADPARLSNAPSLVGPSRTERHGVKNPARKLTRGSRTEWVIGEMKQAGVLVHIGVQRLVGTLRVFLDGDPRPAIEIESVIIFQGQTTLFSGAFSGRTPDGWGVWFPVPFAKSAIVTVDADPGVCEAVFRPAEEKPLQTFRMKDAIIGTFRAGEALAKLKGPSTEMALKSTTIDGVVTVTGATTMLKLSPGEEKVVFQAKEPGGGLLSHFGVEDLGEFLNEKTWSRLLVSVRADDISTVDDVPLLDFLGAPLGLNKMRQYLAGSSINVRSAYRLSVPMPFEKTIRISMRNASTKGVHAMAILARSAPEKWTPMSRHLHVLHGEASGSQPALSGRGALFGWMSRTRGPCALVIDGQRRVLSGGVPADASGTSMLGAFWKAVGRAPAYRNRWMLLDGHGFSKTIQLASDGGVQTAWVFLRDRGVSRPKKQDG